MSTGISSVLFCGCLLFAAGCGSRESAKSRPAEKAPAAAVKQPRAPFVPVDACSLLTKAEVEELTRQSVTEPRKEQAANLVTCSYGDPNSPEVGGRRLSSVVSLAVFTGEEGAYYAGPVAQAKDLYEMGRKNAASPEAVGGLGESAYWDKLMHTLNVYTARYEVSVTVASKAGIELAKKVMTKALSRLP